MESYEAVQKAHADAVAAGEDVEKSNKDVEVYHDAATSLKNAAQVATSAFKAACQVTKDLKAVKDCNSLEEALETVGDAAKSVDGAASDTIKAAVLAATAINNAAKIPIAMGRVAVTAAQAAEARALAARQP